MNMPRRHQFLALIAIAVALTTAGPAQQQPSVIESSLCQQAREHRFGMNRNTGKAGVVRYQNLDPTTWESDLIGLMTKSDVVVLAGIATRNVSEISPSGEDAIQSFDVKVLHTWKGEFKAGQTITFSIPSAILLCAATREEAPNGPAFATMTGHERWGGYPSGPFVLFLRHALGSEKELTPDLRLTGGDGMQGLFYVDYFVYAGGWDPDFGYPTKQHASQNPSMAEQLALVKPCNGVLQGSIEKCLTNLRASKDRIRLQNGNDPLLSKYEGMESLKFFAEVDSVAQSRGYTTLLLEGR